jgi:hypothetical protein
LALVLQLIQIDMFKIYPQILQISKNTDMRMLLNYPQGATRAPRFCPSGRPATPWGRWAKISPLFIPLWITRASPATIASFFVASTGDLDDDYLLPR